MSDWDSSIKRITRTTIATEDGTQVARTDSIQTAIAELKTLCSSRGVGGVFAVRDVGNYEVTISAAYNVRVAEIPEQVFVAGLADSTNLGIYLLDTANRWKAGDLADDSTWRVRSGITVELINVNTGATIADSFLAFNASTAKLTFSGADTPTPRLYDVQFRIDGQLSAPFKIRIQRPTFSFGDESYETLTGITGVPHTFPTAANLGQAIGNRFPAASLDNLALLTASEAGAERYYVATMNKFKNGLASCYLVGVPGKTKIGKKGDSYTTCIIKRCATVVWKNLDISWAWKLGTEDCTVQIADKIRITDLSAADALMFDNTTAWLPENTPQFAWVVNAEFTRCGQGGNKHPIYIHLRDAPLGSRSGGDATTHFNNVWSYGNNSTKTANGLGPQGGCNIKCLSKYFTLRNSKLEQTDNWSDPYNSFVTSQVTSFHAHQRGPIYNNVFKGFNTTTLNFGQDKLLFFQNRNLADSGHDDPPYFNEDPPLPCIPPFQPRACEFTVDLAQNLCKFTQKFSMARAVQISSTGLPPRPLNSVATYYLINQNNSGTRLALTPTGESIKLTDVGTGTHTMTGALTPMTFNPTYHGTNKYLAAPVDVPYWSTVSAKPIDDPTNEHAYHKFISYNVFELVPMPTNNQQVMAAVFDQGNPPCAPTRQFDPEQNYYSVPKNWVERSQVFLGNNVYVGFKNAGLKVVRWNGVTPPAIGVKYPYSVDPLKPRPDPIVVGGERDQGDAVVDVPLPPWFAI